MAHFRGHKGDIMAVLYVLYIMMNLLSFSKGVESRDAWYQGCLGGDVEAAADSFTGNSTETMALDPVGCARHCLLMLSSYCSVSAHQCVCLSRLPDTEVEYGQLLCSHRCSSNGSSVEFPCGSANTTTVYATRGPYLQSVVLSGLPATGFVNTQFTLHVNLTLAGNPLMNLGFAVEGSDALNQSDASMVFSVSKSGSDDSIVISTDKVPLTANETNFLHNVSVEGFNEVGDYDLTVEVSNFLSMLRSETSLVIVHPIPTDLTISLVNDKSKLPACVPTSLNIGRDNESSDNHTSGTVYVFINQKVEFNATLASGGNVTFDWWFDVTGTSDHMTSLSESCVEHSCLQSQQSYTFEEAGQYDVTVQASNDLGQVTAVVSVVVVPSGIMGLQIALQNETSLATLLGSPTEFMIAIETAHRGSTLLEIQFGESTSQWYELEVPEEMGRSMVQISGTMKDEEKGDSDIELLSNTECRFEILVSYTFPVEGMYNVTVRADHEAMGNNSEITVGPSVVVQQGLANVLILCRPAVPVGNPVECTVKLVQGFKSHITYYWSFLHRLNANETASFEDNFTTSEPKLRSAPLDKLGIYEVQLKAENHVSRVWTNTTILVQVPISGARVTLSLNKSYSIAKGNVVSIEASVQSGSDVHFQWNPFKMDLPEPEVVTTPTKSVANFTFNKLSEYNITVEIRNNVTAFHVSLPKKICVQEEITGLQVTVDKAVVLDEVVSMNLSVETGSPVTFDIDYGNGSEKVNQLFPGKSVVVTHTFQQIQLFEVIVYAENRVSQVHRKFEIQVQDKVPEVTLEQVSQVLVKDEYSSFVVKDADECADLPEVVYQWQINKKIVSHSKTPLLSHRFLTAGLYNVTVTVYNLVSKVVRLLEDVIVHETSNQTRFNMKTFNPSGEKTQFKILALLITPIDIHVKYGDTRTNTQHVPENSDTTRGWEDIYVQPNIYLVSATCVLKDRPDLTRHVYTYVCSQEPIKGLTITGPQKVAVTKEPVLYSWGVNKTAGTHVLYNWTLNRELQPITTMDKFKVELYKPGVYSLALNAFNSISNSSTSLEISFIHSITHVTIVTQAVILGNKTSILVMVQGGREFDFKIDFGDGNSTHQNDGEKGVIDMDRVLYNFTIVHTYMQVGEYLINVNVTNHVSWMAATDTTCVQEPISGVRITTTAPSTVELGQTVVVVGTVTTGKKLQFNWDFGTTDSVADILTNGKNSTATLTFKRPDVYTIRLSVTNPLYSQPVQCESPILLQVEQRITGLKFHEVNRKVAAELFPDAENGGARTQPVQFVAEVSGGSNVKFLFDFGDGVRVTVNGTQKDSGIVKGMTRHVFKRDGKYSLSVLAFNDLNETLMKFPGKFYVQERPDINLSKKSYNIELSEMFERKVTVNRGHDLKFDWFMGDTTQYIDKGAQVEHRYLSANRFNLRVEAYNKVGRDEFTATVNVIERILGVEVVIENPVHLFDTEVSMAAHLTPDKPIAQYYRWHFGASASDSSTVYMGSMHSKCHGNSQTEICKFKRNGRYNVTVVAGNDLGNVTSAPVLVHVVEKITAFLLKVYGELLVNTDITFSAYSFSGSDVEYTWLITNSETGETELNVTIFEKSDLIHNFSRIGQYDVDVVATNPLGNVSASITVFILDRICKQPNLKPLQIGSKGKKFFRSEYIKIEVEVKINCSISKATNYKWEVYNTLNGQKEEFPTLSAALFQDRLLYLPPRTLHYGNYTVLLEVEMRNVPIRVFTPQQIPLQIEKSPLISMITGGIKRKVSRQETLVMDGRKSHDPDYLDTSNLTYFWSCKDLKQNATVQSNHPCFRRPNVFDPWLPLLSIPATEFVTHSPSLLGTGPEFEFSLEVCKDGRMCGRLEQVIQVEQQQLLDVTLTCAACEDKLVNSDERLVVEANHGGYPETQLRYKWRLEVVGASTPDSEKEVTLCRSRTSGSQKLVGSDSDPEITTTPPATPTTVLPTTTSPSTTTTEEGDGGLDWLHEGDDEEDLGRESEGDEEDLEGEGCELFFGCGIDFEAEEPDEDREDRDDPGGEGELPDDPNHHDPAENDGATKDSDPLALHVLSRERSQRPLYDEDTVTGVGKRVLVIKPNKLQQDKDFIVGVQVTQDNGSLEGSALVYFRVNKSPHNGQCSLWPIKGVEMETDFTVFCQEWQDENLPLRYEVSFSRQSDQPQDLVYQGLNHEISFKLPAGLPQIDYMINISVYISDNLGSRTYVCQTPVEVLPKAYNTSQKTEEEILYELVQENNSSLSDYVQEGDNRNARLHTQMVATRLNRLNESSEDGNGIRQKIRRAMLWVLKDMPLRDEYEIHQTTTAVVLATEKTLELNEDSLSYATSILDKASQQTDDLVSVGRAPQEVLTSVAAQGTSNILGAVHSAAETLTRQGMKEIVTSTKKVIQSVLHADTSNLVSGENPIQKEYENVLMLGSRHPLHGKVPDIHTDTAKFVVPTTLGEIIENRLKVEAGQELTEEECFQTHVVTYRHNPFLYAEDVTTQVKTKVSALSLLTCSGKEILLSDLDPSDHFHINLQHIVSESDSFSLQQTYTLHKEQINYHQFNLSSHSEANTVNIELDLNPVKDGRLFPIVILIRAERPPTPVEYDFIFEFPRHQDQIHVTLQPGTLNSSSLYYVGVSDAKFNAGKPRQGEVHARQYRFKVWHASCRFWNSSEDRWSVEGCRLERGSTFDEAHCSCNHLTSFAASFDLEPNDLNFKNIEDFFDLTVNPVTFTFIACLFVVYFLLLVLCVRKDKHDKTGGAPIFLIDNTATDKQKYILTLETGFRKNAGTSAKVSIVLHGDDGMSETRELISQSGLSLFERNSRNTFILTLPNSLGPIYKIQLWHNNAGPSPSWFLSRVTIKDVNCGQGYYFSCEKWLAVYRDDGKVEKEFNAIDGGLGFTHVLWAKGTQYFVDYHLWFSTLTRPAYSRFTRAQRLTCCLSLVMSYMAVNAAWYRQTDEQFRGEFGLIDVSWRSVIVGIITSLLVLPPNAFIVWLFRRSRAKRPSIIDEPDEQRRMSGRRDSTSTMDSTSRLLHPVHTPSIFDQSILNWQNLQEWAQKTWAKRYRQSPNGSTQSVQPPIQTMHMSAELERRAIEHNTCLQLAALHQYNGDPPSQRSSGSYGRPHLPLTGKLSDRASSNGTSCTSDGITVSEKDILLSMRSQKPQRCFVPGFFRYFAWFLSAVVILGCAAVTVLYGFRFGRVKSLMWLQSLFFSVMQCVFLTHPLLIFLMTLYIAVKYRNNMSIFDHHDDGLIAEKLSDGKECEIASLKSKKYGEIELSEGIAARQRSRYLRFSRPPHEKTLLKSRNQTIKEHKASIVLNETSIFVAVFVNLSFMAFGQNPTAGYQLSQSLHTAFVNTGNPMAYRDIRDVQQFWQWIQTDFLDTLYSESDSDPASKDSLNKAFTSNSHLVGQVHIRQHRVLEQQCYLPSSYLVTPLCRYAHSTLNRDLSPFGTNGSWWFFTQQQTGSHKMSGRQGTYAGDGFLVMLSRDRSEAERHLSLMAGEDWVDKYTRAVIVEFTLFHPASNLFSSVMLLLEVPVVGQIFPLYRITTANLYKYITAIDNIVLACELLFVVVVLLKLRSVLKTALWQQKQFLRSFWNVLDVLFCMVGVGFCGCFIYRFVVVSQTVEEIRETYKEDFVDMAPLAFWDQILRTFVGVLYFIVILQSVKILRHRRPFAAIGNVLKHASLDLFVVFLVFIVWIAAYTSLAIALYGSLSFRLHYVDSAILSTAGLYTRHYPFRDMETGSAPTIHGWRIFVVTFLVFALGSVTAYTMAVLNFHYKVYREDPKLVLDITDTLKYYWNQLLQWSGLKPFEFPPEEEKLPTECTIAELNYQVDEMLFKINALSGTANLPEKPHIQTVFTDSDTTYGSGGPDIDHHLFLDGVKNMDFWNNGLQDDGKVQLRIKKIEDNLLFQEPHLAQLLVLDNINRDDLALDLRNQLELEIFRQLRNERHSGDMSGVGSDTYPSSLSYHGPPSTNCYQGSASQSQTGSESSRQSGVQDSGRGSPSAKDDSADLEKATKKKVKAKESAAVLEDNKVKANETPTQEEPDQTNRNLYPDVKIANAQDDSDAANGRMVKPSKLREGTPHKALVIPAETNSSADHTDNIPLVDMAQTAKAAQDDKGIEPCVGEALLPQTVINLQNSGSSDAVGSSTSSGGREVQSVLSKGSVSSSALNKSPGGPSICKHNNPMHSINVEQKEREKSGHLKKSDVSHHPADTKSKSTTALHQKSPKLKKTAGEATVFTYDNSMYDTSDSDLSEESSAKSSQPRSLRKTKSRGKGKGQRSELAVNNGLGLDELGFTNEAYIGEKHKGGHQRTKKKKTTKA